MQVSRSAGVINEGLVMALFALKCTNATIRNTLSGGVQFVPTKIVKASGTVTEAFTPWRYLVDLRLTNETEASGSSAAAGALVKAAATKAADDIPLGGIQATELDPTAAANYVPPSEATVDLLPLDLDLQAFKFLQVSDQEHQSR